MTVSSYLGNDPAFSNIQPDTSSSNPDYGMIIIINL